MLRAALFTDPLIVLLTAVMGTLSLVSTFFDKTGRSAHKIARRWARMLLKVSSVQVRVDGLENLSPSASYVFVSNHLSLMDTPVVIGHIPVEFRFLAKHGLFKIPFIGTHLRHAGHIPVPRGDARASIKVMAEAARVIRERGASILAFPEGGRSVAALREFKEGAAYIAIKASVPAVPIAILGTRAILPMHSLLVRPGRVVLRIGDPIPTTGLALHDRGSLTARLRERVAELSSEPASLARGVRPAG